MDEPPTADPMKKEPFPDEDEELLQLQRTRRLLQEKRKLKEEIRILQEEENASATSTKDQMLLSYLTRNNRIQIFPHLAKFDQHLNTIEKFEQMVLEDKEGLIENLERQYLNKLKIGSLNPNDALILQYLFAPETEKLFLVHNILSSKNQTARMCLHNTKLWKEKKGDFASERAKLLLNLAVPLIRDNTAINEKILDIEESENGTVGGESSKKRKKKYGNIFDMGMEEEIISGGEAYRLNVSQEGTVDLSDVRDVIFQLQGQVAALEKAQQQQAANNNYHNNNNYQRQYNNNSNYGNNYQKRGYGRGYGNYGRGGRGYQNRGFQGGEGKEEKDFLDQRDLTSEKKE